jgi:hypothetical protein
MWVTKTAHKRAHPSFEESDLNEANLQVEYKSGHLLKLQVGWTRFDLDQDC